MRQSTKPPSSAEKRLLQCVIVVLALIPVSAGLAGIVAGPAFLALEAPWPADLDSHLRFLSGVFFGVGIAYWTCVPGIERKTARFRLLAAVTVCGGLARLASLAIAGPPSIGHLVGLVMELVVVPALVLWQARVAARGGRVP